MKASNTRETIAMMYPMDTTTMQALHEHHRERLARGARPRRQRDYQPGRPRLAAMLGSIRPRTSDGVGTHGRRAAGGSTRPAAAA